MKNIKFICTSFRNRTKIKDHRSVLLYRSEYKDFYYIFQNVHIMFLSSNLHPTLKNRHFKRRPRRGPQNDLLRKKKYQQYRLLSMDRSGMKEDCIDLYEYKYRQNLLMYMLYDLQWLAKCRINECRSILEVHDCSWFTDNFVVSL